MCTLVNPSVSFGLLLSYIISVVGREDVLDYMLDGDIRLSCYVASLLRDSLFAAIFRSIRSFCQSAYNTTQGPEVFPTREPT